MFREPTDNSGHVPLLENSEAIIRVPTRGKGIILVLVILPIWEENARQVSIKWPQDELPHKPRHSENSSPPHLAFRISA